MMPFAFAVSAKSNEFDKNGDERALSPVDLVGYDYFWVHAFDESWKNIIAVWQGKKPINIVRVP